MKQDSIAFKKAMRVLKDLKAIQSGSQMSPLALLAAIIITVTLTLVLISSMFAWVSVSTPLEFGYCQGLVCQKGVSQ
ncbi:MAG: hypothetical protein V7K39_00355 [Nostoc sp.]